MKFILKCCSFTYLLHKIICTIIQSIEKITQIFFRVNPLFLVGIPHKASIREINMALPHECVPKQGEVRGSQLLY